MKNIWITTATRPDIIKLAPVIGELKKDERLKVTVLHARQHTALAEQAINTFGLNIDISSGDIPNSHYGLTQIFTYFVKFYQEELDKLDYLPDAVIVHGDVMGSLAAAMAAFFNRIPVFHVEAGLRTADYQYPFPEEGTRRLISKVARLHFAPTWQAKKNLINEGVDPLSIIVTGNTIVDAVQLMRELNPILFAHPVINHDSTPIRPIILMTLHRREMWSSPLFWDYLECIGKFAEEHPHYDYVFPVHPNPHITDAVKQIQASIPSTRNIKIVNPFPYDNFIGLLDKHVGLIITDSGGVLEEASILGIPVLVLRNDTERPEAQSIDPEFCKIIGEDISLLRQSLDKFVTDPALAIRKPNNAFGDGKAAQNIHKTILEFFNLN